MTATQPENSCISHRVPALGGDLHVIDQPGSEPAIVLLHGFPDDWRIYRKLLGHLAPRRAVAAVCPARWAASAAHCQRR